MTTAANPPTRASTSPPRSASTRTRLTIGSNFGPTQSKKTTSPTPATPGPAAALDALVEEAVVFGTIVGDDRVELALITADDPPRPGLCAHRPTARPTDIARVDLRMDQPHLPARR